MWLLSIQQEVFRITSFLRSAPSPMLILEQSLTKP